MLDLVVLDLVKSVQVDSSQFVEDEAGSGQDLLL